MSNRPNVTVEGSHAYYRASSAGQCIKALAAQRMGMDPLKPSADMLARFRDGHLHEGPILEEVEQQYGQAVVRRQEEWTIDVSSRVTVVGHVDGILDGDLMPVEAKSAAQDPFMDWDASETKWFSSRPYYAVQWTLTLAAYERTAGVYAVKNKNTGRTLCRVVGAPMTLAEVKTKLLRADLAGRQGKLPECDVKDKWGCPLRYLHEENERIQIEAEVDETLQGLMQAYREAMEQEKRAELVKKELGKRLAQEMGEREKVQAGRYMTTMVAGTSVQWDKEKLQAVVGDDLSPFQTVKHYSYVRVMEVED